MTHNYRKRLIIAHKKRIRIIETYGHIQAFPSNGGSLYVRLVGSCGKISIAVDGDYIDAIDTLYDFLMESVDHTVNNL